LASKRARVCGDGGTSLDTCNILMEGGFKIMKKGLG
jgi:hypothetical protein